MTVAHASVATAPLVQLRHLCRILNGGTPPSGDAESWGGDVPFVTPTDLNGADGALIHATGRTLTERGAQQSGNAPSGSVILTTRAPIGYVGRLASRAAFNQGCRALVPNATVSDRFLAYALIAAREELTARGQGTTFPELSATALASVRLSRPSLELQSAIADHLDCETAGVDALIAKSEQLIALLTERRAAVICRAVTKGLDSNVSLRPSGVPWFGEVPARWQVAPIKRVGTIVLGKMLQESQHDGSEVSLHYLRAASVQPNGVLDLSTTKEMWFTPREVRSLTLQAGDVVIVEGGVGGYGRAAYLTDALPDMAFQNSIARVRPGASDDGRYLSAVLLYLRSVGYIEMVSSVASMPHFTAEKIAATLVTRPPLAEQRRLADHIASETDAIDKAIAVAQRGIDLVRERRAALISTAVAGRLDVRVAA